MVRMEKFCSVTVIDRKGIPQTLRVSATSAKDAAHLYATIAKGQGRNSPLPYPTLDTVFSVQTADRLTSERIDGRSLQVWIQRQRRELRGPLAEQFRRRPSLS